MDNEQLQGLLGDWTMFVSKQETQQQQLLLLSAVVITLPLTDCLPSLIQIAEQNARMIAWLCSFLYLQ